ncbi:hypothetical protein [Reticulibacter mediterranei]|uniref:hypothetical protein n=1 Tax=Reticulibacter mediterranei TaxID=2778369 RepID=UPI001C68DA47|nr:hypothetical protein [Reticulibacter mediterranei]
MMASKMGERTKRLMQGYQQEKMNSLCSFLLPPLLASLMPVFSLVGLLGLL